MKGGIEIGPGPVFRRDIDRRSRPDYAKTGIVKADATLLPRSIECIGQVEGLGVVGQGNKAMGKALWRVHHETVFGRQLGAEPPGEGWRVWPQVDDDVIELSLIHISEPTRQAE